jgi:hypothetical protein
MNSGDMERKRRVLADISGAIVLPLSGEQGVGLTEVLRSLLKSITEARTASPPAFHADPEAVRALERDGDQDSPPTVRGWAP